MNMKSKQHQHTPLYSIMDAANHNAKSKVFIPCVQRKLNEGW